MSQTYFPFASGSGAALTEAQWGQMVRSIMQNGVVRAIANDSAKGTLGSELKVFGDSTGMQVKVPAGEYWVQGYYFASSAQETLAISAADATNPRKDRVIVRLNLSARTIALAVLTGTAAGSPSAPSLTQNSTTWEESLAIVDVAALATTVASGNVTDDRVYTYAAGGLYAWAKFNGSGTAAITASVNVSALTDNGTGDYSFSLRRSVPNGNYFVSALGSGACYPAQDGADLSTSSVRVVWYNAAGSATDVSRAYVGVWSDR